MWTKEYLLQCDEISESIKKGMFALAKVQSEKLVEDLAKAIDQIKVTK